MKSKQAIITSAILFLLFSCVFKNDTIKEKDFIEHQKEAKYVGDSIIGLKELLSSEGKLQEFYLSNYTVIIFVDANCSECVRLMKEWKEGIGEEFNTIFIVSGKPSEQFSNDISIYPMAKVIDKDFKVVTGNKFWGIEKVFLLDKNFNIVAEGNPLVNKKIHQIFKYITNENN